MPLSQTKQKVYSKPHWHNKTTLRFTYKNAVNTITCDNRDLLISVPLHEHIDGIPERLGIEQQGRDILKHDTYTHTKPIKNSETRNRSPQNPDPQHGVFKKPTKVPGFPRSVNYQAWESRE